MPERPVFIKERFTFALLQKEIVFHNVNLKFASKIALFHLISKTNPPPVSKICPIRSRTIRKTGGREQKPPSPLTGVDTWTPTAPGIAPPHVMLNLIQHLRQIAGQARNDGKRARNDGKRAREDAGSSPA